MIKQKVHLLFVYTAGRKEQTLNLRHSVSLCFRASSTFALSNTVRHKASVKASTAGSNSIRTSAIQTAIQTVDHIERNWQLQFGGSSLYQRPQLRESPAFARGLFYALFLGNVTKNPMAGAEPEESLSVIKCIATVYGRCVVEAPARRLVKLSGFSFGAASGGS